MKNDDTMGDKGGEQRDDEGLVITSFFMTRKN